MTVSIGVDYIPGQWKCCLVDQGGLAELETFATANELLASLGQVCALYPEPTIVCSLDASAPFRALSGLTAGQLVRLARSYPSTASFVECKEALAVFSSLSARSYCAPSVVYLPTVPSYRRLMRPALGSARDVCAVAALLHHMRVQDASWQEMNFLFISVDEQRISVLVLQEGRIVNGLGMLQGSSKLAARTNLTNLEAVGQGENQEHDNVFEQALQKAFWEGLTQELAGLLAVHHIEDVVVLGKESDRLVTRLAETYQVYLFPHAQADCEGYEAALGAALLAEGLEQPGNAADLVSYLQIRQAGLIGSVNGFL